MVVAAASVMAISNNDNLRKGLAHLDNISNVKISKKKGSERQPDTENAAGVTDRLVRKGMQWGTILANEVLCIYSVAYEKCIAKR